MSDIVIVAIISFIGTTIGSIIGFSKNTDIINIKFKDMREHLELKIDNLKEQVEKHNKVIERTYSLEERMSVNEEKVKVVNHRVDDLEKEK